MSKYLAFIIIIPVLIGYIIVQILWSTRHNRKRGKHSQLAEEAIKSLKVSFAVAENDPKIAELEKEYKRIENIK